jgi:hypothetical protein
MSCLTQTVGRRKVNRIEGSDWDRKRLDRAAEHDIVHLQQEKSVEERS